MQIILIILLFLSACSSPTKTDQHSHSPQFTNIEISGRKHIQKLMRTGDGTLLATGWISHDSATQLLLLHFDENGYFSQQIAFNPAQEMYGLDLIENLYGELFLCGMVKKSTGKSDSFFAKLNANLHIEYCNFFDFGSIEALTAMTMLHNGTIVVAGHANIDREHGSEIKLAKLRPDGTLLKLETFGWHNDEFASAIIETEAGKLIVAGSTNSFGSGLNDVLLLQLDQDLTLEAFQTYGDRSSELAPKLTALHNGTIVLTNTFQANNMAPTSHIRTLNPVNSTIQSLPLITNVPFIQISAATPSITTLLLGGFQQSGIEQPRHAFAAELLASGKFKWSYLFDDLPRSKIQALLELPDQRIFCILDQAISNSKNTLYSVTFERTSQSNGFNHF